MDKQKLKRLIIDAVSNVEGAEVYRSYSGRRMYDKECLGIDIDNDYSPYGVLMRIGQEIQKANVDASIEFINLVDRHMKQGSFGKGVIVYFPSIEDNYLDYKAEQEQAVAKFATTE